MRLAARKRSRGQGLVELALILPVLLLMVMAALDFGRLFLGWVVLNNAARVGANYAALYPEAWDAPGNAARRSTYDSLVRDARADAEIALTACSAKAVAAPAFPNGKDLGDHAEVTLDCGFSPITPIIGDLFAGAGNPLMVSARSVFPLRSGAVDAPARTPSPICLSDFDWTVDAADSLTVDFADATVGSGGPYLWDFGDATASVVQNPSHTYLQGGTYRVVFRVSGCNAIGQNVSVADPPPSPDPSASIDPDASPPPSASPVPSPAPCITPSFIGTRKNNAPGSWTAAGFSEPIVFDPDPGGNWQIQAQSLVGGFEQACNASITLGPDPVPTP
jgi:hypothetical protein